MGFKTVSYINGEYVSEERTKVSALDLGLLRGFGVFELIKTYRGEPFHTTDHLKRLRSSIDHLQLTLEISDVGIIKIIERLLKVNRLREACIRIVVTGGATFDYILPSGQHSLMIFTTPFLSYPNHYYTHGIHAITFHAERYLPECKSLGYMSAVMGLQQARKKNAQEAIYLNRNQELLEGTTCNFFAIKKDRLITADEGILHGVTRHILLQLLPPHFSIEKRAIHLDELGKLDEAFITSTSKEIMPVVQINDTVIGTGHVGTQTKKVMQLFDEYIKLPLWNLEKKLQEAVE